MQSIYTGEELTAANKADAKNCYTKEDHRGRVWARRCAQHSLHLVKYLLRIAVRRGKGPELIEYIEQYRRQHNDDTFVMLTWEGAAETLIRMEGQVDDMRKTLTALRSAMLQQHVHPSATVHYSSLTTNTIHD